MNNTITLVGHVVNKPVTKSIPEGKGTLTQFTIAVPDSAGMELFYFKVKAFNAQLDSIMEYVIPDREIQVRGDFSIETYLQKGGDPVSNFVVNLKELQPVASV